MSKNIKIAINSFSSFFTVNFRLLGRGFFSSQAGLAFLHIEHVLLLLSLSFFSPFHILFIFFLIPGPLYTNYHLGALQFKSLLWLSLNHCVKHSGDLVCFL